MNKKAIIIVLALAMVASFAYAGNPSKRGTAAASQLLVPVGVRGQSLAGSLLSTPGGVEAIYWNPAGLEAGLGAASVDVLFTQTSYIADIGVSYAGVGVKLGELGTLGFTLRTLNFGQIDETTEDFPNGTGNTFSPTFITLSGTYSKLLTDRISIGFTMKLISEQIIRTSATGFAIDAGVMYKVGAGPLTGLNFGVVLKNIGPNMRYDGTDLERIVTPPDSDPQAQERPLKFIAQDFELPSTFEMGLSYDLMLAEAGNRVTFMGAFQNNNFGDDNVRGGVEVMFGNMLALRAGYGTPNANTEASVFNSLTFGGGLQYPFGDGGRIAIDYGYTEAQIFDAVHSIGLRLTF